MTRKRAWMMRSWRRCLLLCACVAAVAGCGSHRDSAEEHRRLSLRVEHRPPVRTPAGEEAEIHALVRSSLEAPRLEGWIRILGTEGQEKRIPLKIGETGDAVAHLPAHPRGTVLRYVVEAQDAAGLVVALPRGARDGNSYALRYEGSSSVVLGGIAWISALAATLLFLGAGAAAVQTLRGRMSAGPAAMLGGFGAAATILGVLAIGGVHAFQLTGQPWPPRPVLFAMTRADLGILALVWILNLALGRRLLLDEAPEDAPPGQRAFALVGTAAGILTLVFLFV
ncbi:hypothetical protein K8I85_14810 [bacterium]|nr:hypothetical protein [bacterium]